MFEHGAFWRLYSYNAAGVFQADFNGGDPVSPFFLEEITGFDSPNVRQSVEDIPEYDGAVAGNFYYGSRPVTMSGRIVAASATERNQAVANLQRVLRGLRPHLGGDGFIHIQMFPTGMPWMYAKAKIQNLRITGGYVKNFQISMICPDPRIYSQEQHSDSSSATAGAVFGAPWPLAWPVVWGGGTGASAIVNVENVGNIGTPPTLRVYGIIDNPEIRNETTGQSIFIDNVSLAAGEYIDIDVATRTAVSSVSGNIYSRVRFPGTTWWLLEPGVNDIQLRGVSTGAGVQVTVYWRDAWV
jgi:hypothetical protein